MDSPSTNEAPAFPQPPTLRKLEGFDRVSKILISFLIGVVTIGGGILKIGQDKINTELATAKEEREAITQKLNQQLDLRKANREDAQQRTAIMLRIFEKTESTIDNAKDSPKDRAIRERKINATVLLINGLTPYVGDRLFVQGIIGVLGEMTNDPVTKANIQKLRDFEEDTAIYNHEPAPVAAPEGERETKKTSQLVDTVVPSAFAQTPKKGDLRRFRFDIFYCSVTGDPTGTSARKAASKAIFDRIVATGTAGNVRVRDMPEIVNMRPGYGVTANEVRYDPGDQKEVDVMHTIVALLDPAPAGLKPFGTRAVMAEPTPGYVSIFVCAR